MKRNIPIVILRCGFIGPHSATGVSNLNDWLMRFIGGCISEKIFPKGNEIVLFSPVDIYSDAIVDISLKYNQLTTFTYNLVELNSLKISLTKLFGLLRNFDLELQELPESEWIEKISHVKKTNPIFVALSLFNDGFFDMSEDHYDSTEFQSIFNFKTNIDVNSYLKNMIEFMKKEKFISIKSY